MLDAIRTFVNRRLLADAAPSDERAPLIDGLHVAAAALLLELAHADDEFSDGERAHIQEVIRRSFGLHEDSAKALLVLTERERARGANLHEFTDLIASRLDRVQKARLIEMMWELARSDAEIVQHEAFLMLHVAERLGLSTNDMPGGLGEPKLST